MNSNRFQTKPDDSDSGAMLPGQSAATIQRAKPTILRKDELARELSMSPRSIQNLMSRKMIPYYRLSSRFVRFDLQKVRNALGKFEVEEIGRNSRR